MEGSGSRRVASMGAHIKDNRCHGFRAEENAGEQGKETPVGV